MKWLRFLFCILMFSHCKKAEEVKLQSMQVLVCEGINTATLLWELPESLSGSQAEYTVFISDSLVADKIKANTFYLTNLKESEEYSGKVAAYSGDTKIAEQAFHFITLKNQPPGEFGITELTIKSDAVSLKWNASADPEKSSVVYDLFLFNNLKIKGIKGCSATLDSLMPGVAYSGTVVARDSAGKTRPTGFSFRTLTTAGSELVHCTVRFGNYQRTFGYYLPSGFLYVSAAPMVISLHGANGNAWNEIVSGSFKNVAERENFILLMPQALLGSYNGETIYQWNAHYIFPWDDVAFLNYLIDYFFTKYHIDLSRVYLSGMSNGGFMTFFAAREMQERLAAIAPIAGLMSANVYTGYELNRPIPLCYMHGSADPVVAINGSISAADIIALWVNNNQCSPVPVVTHLPDLTTSDNSTVTLYQYNGYSSDSEIQYYIIEGGGHSVPGVEPGANMDINAFEVIWSFFKRHSYPGHAKGNIVE